MDKFSRDTLQKTMQFLSLKGYKVITEFALPNKKRVDLLISKLEFNKRRRKKKIPRLINQTPWQEISRSNVGQLEDGACIRSRGLYIDIAEKKGIPRNNH